MFDCLESFLVVEVVAIVWFAIALFALNAFVFKCRRIIKFFVSKIERIFFLVLRHIVFN